MKYYLVFIYVFLFSSSASIASPMINNSECLSLKLNEELVGTTALTGIDTKLNVLVEGQLFYKDLSGYCIPTNDTYLVGLLGNGYPEILHVLHGHTLNTKLSKFNGDDILFVFYFSGGNQYALKLYRFFNGELKEVDSPQFFSNMRDIQLVENTIVVKNKVPTDTGNFIIKTESYFYKDNKFIKLVNEP